MSANITKSSRLSTDSVDSYWSHVSRDSVLTFQVKSWCDWTFCWSFKLASFLIQVLFSKKFWTLPMICKLSLVEVSLFNEKNGPWKENVYYFGSGLLRTKKSFCRIFDIEHTGSVMKSTFGQTSTSNAFLNLVCIKIKSQEHFLHFLKISESNHQLKTFWLIYLNQNIMVYI